MKLHFKGFLKIVKNTFKEWKAADPFRQSAVIAYYAIFSIPALLVLVINIAGLVFEKKKLSGEISRQVEGAMGSDTATQVQDMIEKAGQTKEGIFANIIGIVAIILGATGVFVELQKSLNNIWGVKKKPDAGFMTNIKDQVFSFGLIVSIGFLLLVSLLISSVLSAASHWLEARFPEVVTYLFFVLEFVVSLGVISCLFALMFKILPDVKVKWRSVWIGSALTGLLFMVGKYALSIYFGKAQPASVYGAAGSIILILLWVSYSSMIVFFGAEFTKQYALYHGIKLVTRPNAVLTDEPVDEPASVKDEVKKEKPSLKNEREEFTQHPGAIKIKSVNELKNRIGLKKEKLSEDVREIKESLRPKTIFEKIKLMFRKKKPGLQP
jgi:membrane protein